MPANRYVSAVVGLWRTSKARLQRQADENALCANVLFQAHLPFPREHARWAQPSANAHSRRDDDERLRSYHVVFIGRV